MLLFCYYMIIKIITLFLPVYRVKDLEEKLTKTIKYFWMHINCIYLLNIIV